MGQPQRFSAWANHRNNLARRRAASIFNIGSEHPGVALQESASSLSGDADANGFRRWRWRLSRHAGHLAQSFESRDALFRRWMGGEKLEQSRAREGLNYKHVCRSGRGLQGDLLGPGL